MAIAVRRSAALGVSLTMGVYLALTGVATPADAVPDWSWLVPFGGPASAAKPGEVYRLPGSSQTITYAQLRDLTHAVDWFPNDHPPMPTIVAEGHDTANACGFCHLPTGNGRPENSALAGLSADYIKRQITAFADGSRRSAVPDNAPAALMAATARSATAAEVEAAALYFSRLRYVSYVDVVETTEAGFRAGSYIYVLQPGPKQPIGERIIEAPVDLEKFEHRDPHARFVAYVPRGSIESGRKLAASGGPARQPCGACHGDGLKGGIAPPLAGRPPTMLMRQLAAFHEGARQNPEAAPMRAIAAPLDTKMMISLAAYAGSLRP